MCNLLVIQYDIAIGALALNPKLSTLLILREFYLPIFTSSLVYLLVIFSGTWSETSTVEKFNPMISTASIFFTHVSLEPPKPHSESSKGYSTPLNPKPLAALQYSKCSSLVLLRISSMVVCNNTTGNGNQTVVWKDHHEIKKIKRSLLVSVMTWTLVSLVHWNDMNHWIILQEQIIILSVCMYC